MTRAHEGEPDEQPARELLRDRDAGVEAVAEHDVAEHQHDHRRQAGGDHAVEQPAVAAEDGVQLSRRSASRAISTSTRRPGGVGAPAEALDRSLDGRRDDRVRAPRLARGDVAHVHLDHREGHRLDRVVQRHAVLRQPGRVDERALHRVDPLVQLVDQRAFVVRLEALELGAELGGQRLQLGVDLGERGRAVDVRLAPAEQVEVRAVQDQELHAGSLAGCGERSVRAGQHRKVGLPTHGKHLSASGLRRES